MTKICRRLSKHALVDKRSEDEAKFLRSAINSSKECLDFLIEVLDKRLNDLDVELEKDTIYSSSAYAYKVSGILESRKEIRNIIKLISETEE